MAELDLNKLYGFSVISAKVVSTLKDSGCFCALSTDAHSLGYSEAQEAGNGTRLSQQVINENSTFRLSGQKTGIEPLF